MQRSQQLANEHFFKSPVEWTAIISDKGHFIFRSDKIASFSNCKYPDNGKRRIGKL